MTGVDGRPSVGKDPALVGVSRQLDLTRFAAARLLAVEMYPFLAPALFSLTPRSAPGLGTFAVSDRLVVSLDPAVLVQWDIREVAGVLLHETSHVIREHHHRAVVSGVDLRHAKLWNVAGDAEINDDLLRDGIPLPSGGITPELLGEPPQKSVEYYFHRLLEKNASPPPDFVCCGSGATLTTDGEGSESGDGDAGSDGGDGVWLIGSGGDPSQASEDRDSQIGIVGLSDAELVVLRMQVAQLILQRGHLAGTLEGGWDRWAEATVNPVVPWRQVMRGAVRRALNSESGFVHSTYVRRSRRTIPGVVLPGWRRPVPKVSVIIDTSGSMPDELLNQAWGECLACMSAHGARREAVSVWAGDVSVKQVDVSNGPAHLIGGGGTDMAAAIETVLAARERADLIVVLTDGHTPWPDEPVATRVLAVMLPHPIRPNPPPGWMHTVWVPPRPGVDDVDW